MVVTVLTTGVPGFFANLVVAETLAAVTETARRMPRAIDADVALASGDPSAFRPASSRTGRRRRPLSWSNTPSTSASKQVRSVSPGRTASTGAVGVRYRHLGYCSWRSGTRVHVVVRLSGDVARAGRRSKGKD
jgi:hypothetical protein